MVIELKTGDFKPEYAGQLNFYLSAVDGILKKEHDNPSIGLLLCKSKNNLVAEYSLKDISKPIGVSEYKVTSDIVVAYKYGKTSQYGEIDQTSATLRDCPVGGPLISYFSNLYSSFSDAEKKQVNAFQMWGLMRYYQVEISYNGRSFKQLMIHVIRFYVSTLPSYNPTL